jgi:hypothetical protein
MAEEKGPHGGIVELMTIVSLDTFHGVVKLGMKVRKN